MAKAEAEMSHWSEYSYLVLNEDFDGALRKLAAILLAERLKRVRQLGLGAQLSAQLTAALATRAV